MGYEFSENHGMEWAAHVQTCSDKSAESNGCELDRMGLDAGGFLPSLVSKMFIGCLSFKRRCFNRMGARHFDPF